MKKKLGMLATLAVALFATIQPAAAQDRYDWNRGHGDRDHGHYAPAYAYPPNREWRAPGYREEFRPERDWRAREWRADEWRDNRRFGAYGYGYAAPAPSFGFEYNRCR